MPEGAVPIAWMALFFFYTTDLSPEEGFGGGHRVEGILTVGAYDAGTRVRIVSEA
jgi:hypothetical protein